MAVTITINDKFKHLNADRSYTIKPGGVGVEKEMVCDIVISGTADFASGLATVDFTQVGLRQVYDCIITQQTNFGSQYYTFVEAAGSDAATAQIHGKNHSDNLDVAATHTVTLQVVVRGV